MIKSAWNLRIEPRPYQSKATEWALAKGQTACSLPAATGKTLVVMLWPADWVATPVENKQARGS